MLVKKFLKTSEANKCWKFNSNGKHFPVKTNNFWKQYNSLTKGITQKFHLSHGIQSKNIQKNHPHYHFLEMVFRIFIIANNLYVYAHIQLNYTGSWKRITAGTRSMKRRIMLNKQLAFIESEVKMKEWKMKIVLYAEEGKEVVSL